MWRSPRGCTAMRACGSDCISRPAPPAWSRWTWVGITQSTAERARSSACSVASRRGTAWLVPVSTKAARPPSTIRYAASKCGRSKPVSIVKRSSPSASTKSGSTATALRSRRLVRVHGPQATEVGAAVVALHAAQGLHGLVLLARLQQRQAEVQLGILGALEAALGDALLDQ